MPNAELGRMAKIEWKDQARQKREIENNICTGFFPADSCRTGHGNLSRTKCVENLGKCTRRTAIFRIFVPKRMFHGPPGQIY